MTLGYITPSINIQHSVPLSSFMPILRADGIRSEEFMTNEIAFLQGIAYVIRVYDIFEQTRLLAYIHADGPRMRVATTTTFEVQYDQRTLTQPDAVRMLMGYLVNMIAKDYEQQLVIPEAD